MTTQTVESMLAVKPRGGTAGATDLGVPALAVRKDAGGDLAGADGKYTPLQTDADGNLRVNIAAGGTSGGATAANQVTEIAGLASIDSHVDGLETLVGTSNTTLAAIDGHVDGLEAGVGAPADTTANADTGIFSIIALIKRGLARWTALFALLPAALTAGGNFKVAVNEAIAAGTNEIGKTNLKHINIAATGAGILTRPANVTAYAVNDSVSDNATAGSVTALPVTVSDTNDDPIDLTEILLDTNDTGFGGATVRVHVFNSDPTANTGVGGGDNAAWSQKRAGWAGSFSGTMIAFSDGCRGTLISDGAPVRVVNVESTGKRLWWQLQTLSAVTPSANGTIFTPRFKGYQGRA